MKFIPTNGITYLRPLDGAENIYFGTETPHGDLFEAEELYRDGGPFLPGRLIFVKYPSGEVTEPVIAGPGQYFGEPVWCQGAVYILLADFPAGEVRILETDGALRSARLHASVPLEDIAACYNLMLKSSPLMLTRQTIDTLEVIWPERRVYSIGERETFRFRDGDELWFSRWNEESGDGSYSYWDDMVIRDLDGNEKRTVRGDVRLMPGGEKWILC